MNKTGLLADLAARYAKVGNSTQVADATLPSGGKKYKVPCVEINAATGAAITVEVEYYVFDEGQAEEDARYKRGTPSPVLTEGTKTTEDQFFQWAMNNIPDALAIYAVHGKQMTGAKKWMLCTAVIRNGATAIRKEYCVSRLGANPYEAIEII